MMNEAILRARQAGELWDARTIKVFFCRAVCASCGVFVRGAVCASRALFFRGAARDLHNLPWTLILCARHGM